MRINIDIYKDKAHIYGDKMMGQDLILEIGNETKPSLIKKAMGVVRERIINPHSNLIWILTIKHIK